MAGSGGTVRLRGAGAEASPGPDVKPGPGPCPGGGDARLCSHHSLLKGSEGLVALPTLVVGRSKAGFG